MGQVIFGAEIGRQLRSRMHCGVFLALTKIALRGGSGFPPPPPVPYCISFLLVPLNYEILGGLKTTLIYYLAVLVVRSIKLLTGLDTRCEPGCVPS